MQNSAEKIRDAAERLSNIVGMWKDHLPPIVQDDVLKALEDLEEALSQPKRNCDVGTPKEQIARHQNYCGNGSGNIRCINSHDHSECKRCFAKWMQLPYNGGCIE